MAADRVLALNPRVSGADIAETTVTVFARDKNNARHVRFVVPPGPADPGSQLALLTTWEHHAFITDRTLPLAEVKAGHRRHTIAEHTIAELEGVGLTHLPSDNFTANPAWLALGMMAHNLGRAIAILAGPDLQPDDRGDPAPPGLHHTPTLDPHRTAATAVLRPTLDPPPLSQSAYSCVIISSPRPQAAEVTPTPPTNFPTGPPLVVVPPGSLHEIVRLRGYCPLRGPPDLDGLIGVAWEERGWDLADPDWDLPTGRPVPPSSLSKETRSWSYSESMRTSALTGSSPLTATIDSSVAAPSGQPRLIISRCCGGPNRSEQTGAVPSRTAGTCRDAWKATSSARGNESFECHRA